MRRASSVLFSSCVSLVLACGDSSGGGGEATTLPGTESATDSQSSDSQVSDSQTGASDSTPTMGDGDGDESGPPTAEGDGDGDTTTNPSMGDGDGEGDGDGDSSSSDSGPKFDNMIPDEPGDPGCQGNGENGELDFSYIWIANSPQGTVSKIDTQTMVEEARYQARPQGGGMPSRTSVNLNGDVVVASREGGVTKIFASPEDCVDSNGTPGLQTSTGKNDVLAWGEEECIAWYADYSFMSERAVAWTSGSFNQGTCEWEGAKVWVGATNDAVNLEVLRLDGQTGEEEDAISIPGTDGFMSRAPYGAAVDLDNNLWMVNGYCGASLVFVDNDDLSYEIIAPPQQVCAYGLAVDSQGYVWVGGYQTYTGRYDPETQQWDLIQAQGLGIQEDAEGRMWLGAYGQNGVYEIDADTLEVLSYTALPTTGQSKGVAVDFFGYIWVVSDGGTTALRMDPDTYEFETYAGLDSPYSYSDMTGWGLKNTAGAPQG